jgi:hypothetical protein
MADAIGPTLYVGAVLKHQKITPRRPVRRTSTGIPVRAPEGMTRAEVAEVLARVERDGKAVFGVGVSLTTASGLVVAEMQVDWHLRKNG